mgnify:CR=1 FL=1
MQIDKMANLTKHWKSYTNPDYIGAYTFLTESNGTIVSTPQIYTITDVRQKDVTGEGGKSSKEIVVSLSGEAKGMIMNAGNSKKMIELFGDICMIPDNWVGKTIKVGALKIMERKQYKSAQQSNLYHLQTTKHHLDQCYKYFSLSI